MWGAGGHEMHAYVRFFGRFSNRHGRLRATLAVSRPPSKP
jgi:hypothetical protein